MRSRAASALGSEPSPCTLPHLLPPTLCGQGWEDPGPSLITTLSLSPEQRVSLVALVMLVLKAKLVLL